MSKWKLMANVVHVLSGLLRISEETNKTQDREDNFFVTLVISTLVITNHVKHPDMINEYLSLAQTDGTGS